MLALLTPACTSTAASKLHAGCGVEQAGLVGNWAHAGGDCFFQEFQLAREDGAQPFRSWLHQRPGVGGSWSFDTATCRLHIEATDLRWDYHVALHGDTLHLRDSQDDDARYRRFTD